MLQYVHQMCSKIHANAQQTTREVNYFVIILGLDADLFLDITF